MVEVGSLEIGGSINTTEIESGLYRIESGFDNISAKTDGINADFERMAQTGMFLNKTFLGMAALGTTAIIALTKGSPAVASSMAQMQVSAGELQRKLGEALAPAFELVSEAFQDFVGWVSDHQEGISYFSETIIGGLIGALSGVHQAWSWITDNINDFMVKIGIDWDLGSIGNYLLEHFGPEMVAGLIGASVGGALGGPWGAVAGFAVTAFTTGVVRRIDNPQLGFNESVVVSGILSILSGLSESTLRRIIGLTGVDRV
jgi:uncharacterized membrane protein YeaQ/YmgE (transglycosylase-associated protein family)